VREGGLGPPPSRVARIQVPLSARTSRIRACCQGQSFARSCCFPSQARLTLPRAAVRTQRLPVALAVPEQLLIAAMRNHMIGLRGCCRPSLKEALTHHRWYSTWSHAAEGVPSPKPFRGFVPRLRVPTGVRGTTRFSRIHEWETSGFLLARRLRHQRERRPVDRAGARFQAGDRRGEIGFDEGSDLAVHLHRL
jgi:hypothetical protein